MSDNSYVQLNNNGLNLPDAYQELLVSDGTNFRRVQLEPHIKHKIEKYTQLHANDFWTDLEAIRQVETSPEELSMLKWKYWMYIPKVTE